MEETISSDTPGERVLIVEDDHSTRTGLAELVQNWGFQTDEAPDGEEALQKVTSFRPAIIVSDLVMDVLAGQIEEDAGRLQHRRLRAGIAGVREERRQALREARARSSRVVSVSRRHPRPLRPAPL